MNEKIKMNQVGIEQQDRRVDIIFQDLYYSVKQKAKKTFLSKDNQEEKVILNNINGICKNTEVTAILGASGAGKTSLLNILCRRIVQTNTNTIKGYIFANENPYNDETFSLIGAYVMQDDRLLEALTVKESLDFAASLRIRGTQEQKNKLVLTIIKELQLERCLNTPIGGTFVKGISGGERKRTSIGFELVTDPQVLFLDEPTSGLDSFTAFLVIKQMNKFAHEKQRTVVFTIHQPSSDIWNLFDKIMFLVRGKLIYQGKGGLDIINYFKNMGFNCPEDSNPADYFMSIMHHNSPENVKNFPTYFSNYDTIQAPNVDNDIKNKLTLPIQKRGVQNSFFFELRQILKRTIIQMSRNKILVKGRFAQNVILAVFSGAIYYQLPNKPVDDININQRNIFNKLGFLFFACMSNFMSSMNPVILTFPAERAVFLKEENSKLYRTTSYFFGRTMIEIPFTILIPLVWALIVYWMIDLNDNSPEQVIIFCFIQIILSMAGNSLGILGGSAFSDPKVALGFTPMLMLPFMIFAGFYSNRQSFADWIGWLEYISPFKYAFEALCRNEFDGIQINPSPIEMLGFSLSLWKCIWILIGLFFGYRILALIFLTTLKKRLQ